MKFGAIASHSIDWWLTAEDLPDPNNRVTLRDDSIQLSYQEIVIHLRLSAFICLHRR